MYGSDIVVGIAAHFLFFLVAAIGTTIAEAGTVSLKHTKIPGNTIYIMKLLNTF